MSLSQQLYSDLEKGSLQIGQLLIAKLSEGYEIRHYHDAQVSSENLETHTDRFAGRTIGVYTPDGEYRFTKGELSLKQGWRVILTSADDLLDALNAFYPGSYGLSQAHQTDKARVQNLRDKLNRQTGMYRYAGSISDNGAQKLVQKLCGPANKCVKKILWDISADIPLKDSEASRFDGIVEDAADGKKVPMVCQEACNFFVAECRKAAKKEFDTANQD